MQRGAAPQSRRLPSALPDSAIVSAICWDVVKYRSFVSTRQIGRGTRANPERAEGNRGKGETDVRLMDADPEV